ncbi:cell division protein FtsZ [Escherichia coli]|uniref:Cell division protein FtsZ n=1 Tax=Escherichia coli TaxID=562 RepID=A0A2X1KWJ7_ECOLX|nr:cell division protein FtsZ [Escherichia coli]
MDKRPEITLVTNKQVQQPVMDRYQQHGMGSADPGAEASC